MNTIHQKSKFLPVVRLTDKAFWDSGYETTTFQDQKEHAIALFLNRWLEKVRGKTALELGSYPGSFLPTIGRKGYLLNGVDFNEKNKDELPAWLTQLNVPVGTFLSGDLQEFTNNNCEKFDLVCSFGLIEHFKNFEELIIGHASLVKKGGKLIITTPNFRGLLQYFPRLCFDKANLALHFLPSMNPKQWKKCLEANGFEVLWYGHFGGFAFWVDQNAARGKLTYALLRITEKSIFQLKKLFARVRWNAPSFSAYCGIVAIKK